MVSVDVKHHVYLLTLTSVISTINHLHTFAFFYIYLINNTTVCLSFHTICSLLSLTTVCFSSYAICSLLSLTSCFSFYEICSLLSLTKVCFSFYAVCSVLFLTTGCFSFKQFVVCCFFRHTFPPPLPLHHKRVIRFCVLLPHK